jgi:Fic family protein
MYHEPLIHIDGTCSGMVFDPRRPFNDLPLLPPLEDVETKDVLKACIGANRALAELKGAGDLIPNQTILINAIPLQEAKASSAIENIVTTKDKLFRAAADPLSSVDPATKEVLWYRTALNHGAHRIRANGMTVDLIESICGVLRNKDVKFRDEERVVIQSSTAVVYTPPRGRDVIREKLANLVHFLSDESEDSLDPLVKMAIAHYQFEAIHPFDDGNGRTGRILNLLYLVDRKLLSIPVLYLSRFIIQNKNEYYTLLRSVTEQQDWKPWLLYMLQGVEETSRWTTKRIHAIRNLFESTVEKCRAELPSRVYSKELVELIFVQPYCKIQFLVDAGMCERKTASGYLKNLEEVGVLESEKVGREVIYRHPALLDLLSE